MELAFVPKAESGWRGRGAPRRDVPQQILDMLRRAAQTGDIGRVDVSDDTEKDVRELLSVLRAGARQLGCRIRIQQTDTDEGRVLVLFEVGEPL